MSFTGFFVSFYINQVASSDMRATVLSFKGLAYNLSYGILGVLYALALKIKRQGLETESAENTIFMETFAGFPLTFIIGFVILTAFYLRKMKNPSQLK
jgi:hypothetical protein